MNTDKHTVTIPIADYNELVKSQDFVGVIQMERTSEIFQAVDTAMRQINMRNGRDVGIPETIQFYYKIL